MNVSMDITDRNDEVGPQGRCERKYAASYEHLHSDTPPPFPPEGSQFAAMALYLATPRLTRRDVPAHALANRGSSSLVGLESALGRTDSQEIKNRT